MRFPTMIEAGRLEESCKRPRVKLVCFHSKTCSRCSRRYRQASWDCCIHGRHALGVVPNDNQRAAIRAAAPARFDLTFT